MGPRFLVIGGGSIGERHIRVFGEATRWQISVCDPRSDRVDHLTNEYPIDKAYTDISEVDLSRYPSVAVCTPTHTHIPIATQAVEAGCNVLLEKPISTSLAGVDTLLALAKERDVIIQMGYVIRSHPGLLKAKEWLDAGAIGEVLAARVKVGYCVPHARPDYRHTYWAKSETGGGVIMDASHQLDYIQWMLGEPEEVSCFTSRRGKWDVDDDIEDIATLMLRYPNGTLVDLHLNHFQLNYTHDLELIGRDGTITWSYPENRSALYDARKEKWDTVTFELVRDDMYIAQARSFAEAVRGDAPPRVTGEDGAQALRLGLAALQSARTHSIVRLKNGDEI